MFHFIAIESNMNGMKKNVCIEKIHLKHVTIKSYILLEIHEKIIERNEMK